MFRKKVESKIGKITNGEFFYALEQLEILVNSNDYNYRTTDYELYDYFIQIVIDTRQKGVQNV